MKKLMMVMVAAAMTAVANAASVDWQTAKNTVLMKDGSVAANVEIYILNTGSSSYDMLIAALTDGSATATNLNEYEAYVGSGITGTGSKNSGKANGTAVSDEFTAGNSYNLAYLIFDKDGAQDYFYISSAAAGKAWSTSEEQALATAASWATTAAPGTWTAVETVPEPTSGLLLLLGMAGLALRRRCA